MGLYPCARRRLAPPLPPATASPRREPRAPLPRSELASILVYPTLRIVSNYWAASWRFALMEHYVAHWHATKRPVEGASQRVHEDTQRFAKGITWIAGDLLDSVSILLSFSPLLAQVGAEVPPPGYRKGEVGGYWLMLFVWGSSFGGICISAFLGRHLVQLEVNNQVHEARLRRDLVLVETAYERLAAANGAVRGPAGASGAGHARAEPLAGGREVALLEKGADNTPLPTRRGGMHSFAPVLTDLWRNYAVMYAHIGGLGYWNELWSNYDEVVPYVLLAPRLVASDAAYRLSYGDLTRLSNATGHVFRSLTRWSNNWVDLAEWVSVIRRLLEFESTLYEGRERRATSRGWPGRDQTAPPGGTAVAPAGAPATTSTCSAAEHVLL